MGFPRQEYWSGWNGLPFPSPGDLPNPGLERTPPALAGRYCISETPGMPSSFYQFLAILSIQFSGVSPLISASLFTWLFLCVYLYLFSLLLRVQVTGLEAILN